MPWETHSTPPRSTRGQPAQTNDGTLFLVQAEEVADGSDIFIYRWDDVDTWDLRATVSAAVVPTDLRVCAIGTTDKLLIVTSVTKGSPNDTVNLTVYDDSAQTDDQYTVVGDFCDSTGLAQQIAVCPFPGDNRVMIVICRLTASAPTASGEWTWIVWDYDTTAALNTGEETGESTFQWTGTGIKYSRAWIGVLTDPINGAVIHIGLPMQDADTPCYWFDEDSIGADDGAWVIDSGMDAYVHVEDDPGEFYDPCSAAFLDRIILPQIDGGTPWAIIPDTGARVRALHSGDGQSRAWVGSVSAIAGQVAHRLRRPVGGWDPGSPEDAFLDVWSRAPWVSWWNVAETSPGEVTVSWTFASAEGGVQTHYEVELRQGAAVIEDSGEVASAAATHVFDPVAAGSYTAYIRAKENGVWSAWVSSGVGVGGGGGGGSDPPTCSITAPSASDVVSGSVAVTADVTDDVALDYAELWIDGVAIATDSTITGTSDTASFTWASGEWYNGAHSIEVRCYDTDALFVSDSISVTTNNVFADVARILFSTCQLLPSGGGHTVRRLFEAISWDAVTGDAFQDYSCRVYVRRTATDSPSTDLDDFHSVDAPGEQTHEPPPGSGEYYQWAINAIPRLWQLIVELTGSSSVIAFCTGPASDDVYILAGTAAGAADMILFRYDSDGLTTVATLPGMTAALRGVAYLDDGNVYVAQGAHLTAIDPDSGEVNVDLGIDPAAGITAVHDVARESATEALVATVDASTARVYRYTHGSTELVGTTGTVPVTGAIRLTAAPASAVTYEGDVYLLTDLATPSFSSGQDESTVLCEGAPGEMILGTSDALAGIVYSDTPSWAASLTLSDLAITGVAYTMDALWASGTTPEVWRRNPTTGVWALRFDVSSDLDDIDRLAPVTLDDGEALLIGGTKSGVARMLVYREAPEDAGAILSGPNPPRIVGGIADSTKD